MKIVFSTKNVTRPSFLDTCAYAYDYGFEGFEIYDAVKERNDHYDSILRRDKVADSKRKLRRRRESEYVFAIHIRHNDGRTLQNGQDFLSRPSAKPCEKQTAHACANAFRRVSIGTLCA